jgi:hypothetical protein
MAITINTDGQPTSTIPDLLESNKTLYNEYKCRAWVNFTGTGTISINGSGNVSTLNDLDTGTYQVNFTIPMPDVNYSAVYSNQRSATAKDWGLSGSYDSTVSSVKFVTTNNVSNLEDFGRLFLAVFR